MVSPKLPKLLGISHGKPRLTVSGIFHEKRKAYEKDRVRMSDDLGFPVKFVYDSDE